MRIPFFLLLVICLFSCKRQDYIYPFEQENVSREGLSFKEDSIISSISTINLTASDIILGNGETMSEYEKRLGLTTKTSTSPNGNFPTYISFSSLPVNSPSYDSLAFNKNLLDRALELEDVSNKSKKDPELDEIINGITYSRPAQVGLGYAFGSKIISKRQIAGNCKIKIYGLDCSGMASLMFNNAGVAFYEHYNAAQLSTPAIINFAIRSSPALKNFDYEYEIRPKTHISKVSAGDIMYFKNANGIFHIGIILNGKNGRLNLFQSNGVQEVPFMGNHYRGCDIYGISDRRGPHQVDIFKMIAVKEFQDYGFLHLVPRKKGPENLVGSWKLIEEKSYTSDKRTKISTKLIDIVNATISFDNKNNYIAYGEDTGKFYGTFVNFNKANDTWLRLSDEIFSEKKPQDVQILEISEKKLRLGCFWKGLLLYSELNFEKQ